MSSKPAAEPPFNPQVHAAAKQRLSDVATTLLTDGAVFNAVAADPQMRNFYWVAEELQNNLGVATNEQCARTMMQATVWDRPGTRREDQLSGVREMAPDQMTAQLVRAANSGSGKQQ